MEILQHIWGSTPEGEGIILYTMRNSRGSEVHLCNIGASIVGVKFADREGKIEDVAYFEPFYLKDFVVGTAKKTLLERVTENGKRN